jgi:hypothetical protein
LFTPKEQVLLNMNADGVGYIDGDSMVAEFDCSQSLKALIDELLPSYAALSWTEPWPQSDHSLFWQ